MNKDLEFRSESANREQIREWIENYLIKPHENLGRKGPVCPWAKTSYENGLYRIDSSDSSPNSEQIVEELRTKREAFVTEASGLSPDDRIYLVHHIAFEKLSTEEDARLLDAIQASRKIEFMNYGLMIGQFHPFSAIGGLHNQTFKPFQCPVHSIVIRHMVESDHLFIPQNLSNSQIPDAAAAYLKKFGDVLPKEILQSRGLID